jgi:hypothetical protein
MPTLHKSANLFLDAPLVAEQLLVYLLARLLHKDKSFEHGFMGEGISHEPFLISVADLPIKTCEAVNLLMK